MYLININNVRYIHEINHDPLMIELIKKVITDKRQKVSIIHKYSHYISFSYI